MHLELPISIVGVIITLLMIVAAEVGFQIGQHTEACDSGVGAVKASTLALVGLLLAFSYSIAAGHYDRRVQVIVSEAKAFKACWLRADFADEPARSRARELLRSIVDARLEGQHRSHDPDADEHIASAQSELWTIAAAQMNDSNDPIKHALFVEAISDVINRGGERTAAIEDRVPAPVMFLLIAAILVSGLLIGLSSGQDKRRIPTLWIIVIVLMVVVLTMIFDLDNPGRGVIVDPHKPLEDVKAAFGPVGASPN